MPNGKIIRKYLNWELCGQGRPSIKADICLIIFQLATDFEDLNYFGIITFLQEHDPEDL